MDSVGNTYGNNTITDDCGFIWFLNTAYSYVRALKKKKEKLRYQKVFGEENEQFGTERFPLMVSDEKVFIQQQETYNCGVATVLHIADFYIYQEACAFNSTFEKLVKKGQQYIVEIDDDGQHFGRLWRVKEDSLPAERKNTS